MKKVFLFFCIISPLIFGQLNTIKYLVLGDSIVTFASQYRNLEICVVDSATQDTVVLEKQSLSTGGWANISTFSNVTGAVVTSMIPGVGMGGAYYYLSDFGEGYFRLRMIDDALDASLKGVKVKITGKP